MMPLELEAECVRFLDRCLDQVSWHPADELPPMHTERFEDENEMIEYQISDPVLAFTDDEEMVTVRATKEFVSVYWFDIDGGEYKVTHWRKLPDKPKEDMNA